MATVQLFPTDIYNQKTIQQGHPPEWNNRKGGDYDLVVLGGGPAGLVAAMTAAAAVLPTLSRNARRAGSEGPDCSWSSIQFPFQ